MPYDDMVDDDNVYDTVYDDKGETMHLTAPHALTRPTAHKDAGLVHAVYSRTPKYFDIISIPVPTLAEVERELEAAAGDARRCTELILATDEVSTESRNEHVAPLDPVSGLYVVGYLDYKLDYPDPGDAMVNLLMIAAPRQGRGYGKRCVADLETRLSNRAKRVLASIYGQKSQGYPLLGGHWLPLRHRRQTRARLVRKGARLKKRAFV